MRKLLITLGALLSLFLVFRWDYYLSNYLLEQLCSDPELIGQHINEKDYIDRKHTRPQSTKNGYQATPFDAYYYDGEVEIPKSYLDSEFEYKKNERIEIYGVGPIALNQSSIRRKKDGKLLSRATTATNEQGWLERALSFGYHGTYCSSVEAKEDDQLTETVNIHLNLLRETLFIK